MLGPKYLVAPVTAENAPTQTLYFQAGADWMMTVDEPLDKVPVYSRQ